MTDFSFVINWLRNGCDPKEAANELVYYQKHTDVLETLYDQARSLLDGAYEVVELFNPETPSQVTWKQNWLEGARKHGASSL